MPIDRQLWTKELATLQLVLAYLFPGREDGKLLCDEAGLPTDRIDFGEPAAVRWFHICDEAIKQEGFDKLLVAASSRYPNNTALNDAMAAWVKVRGLEAQGLLMPAEQLVRSLVADVASIDIRLQRLEDLIRGMVKEGEEK